MSFDSTTVIKHHEEDGMCEHLIRVSFHKIANSKMERGGARLRKNLLILHLLQEARNEQKNRLNAVIALQVGTSGGFPGADVKQNCDNDSVNLTVSSNDPKNISGTNDNQNDSLTWNSRKSTDNEFVLEFGNLEHELSRGDDTVEGENSLAKAEESIFAENAAYDDDSATTRNVSYAAADQQSCSFLGVENHTSKTNDDLFKKINFDENDIDFDVEFAPLPISTPALHSPATSAAIPNRDDSSFEGMSHRTSNHNARTTSDTSDVLTTFDPFNSETRPALMANPSLTAPSGEQGSIIFSIGDSSPIGRSTCVESLSANDDESSNSSSSSEESGSDEDDFCTHFALDSPTASSVSHRKRKISSAITPCACTTNAGNYNCWSQTFATKRACCDRRPAAGGHHSGSPELQGLISVFKAGLAGVGQSLASDSEIAMHEKSVSTSDFDHTVSSDHMTVELACVS